MKSNIQKRKGVMFTKRNKTLTINQRLDIQTKKAINDARQPGASSWLSDILLGQYGFSISKAEFRDAILLCVEKN